jgi:hypothetical protein
MSSRVINSRFNRTESRRGSARIIKAAMPAEPRTVEPEAALADNMPEGEPETLNLRFGFVMVHGKMTVIDLSEEIWGTHRYFCASLSEDPSVCIKALSAEEALVTLIRHLRLSPTIRSYYFERTTAVMPRRLPKWALA